MLSASAQALWQFLSQESSPAARAEEDLWLKELEGRTVQLANAPEPSQENLRRLTVSRAVIANSLRNNAAAIAQWNAAQTLLDEWLVAVVTPGLKQLVSLNAMLTATEGGGWRSGSIVTTQITHPSPADLPALMDLFAERLEHLLENDHPLRAACFARYAVASIHPFADANGRSSQLFSDYILLRHGFPPQAFASQVEGFIIGDPVLKPHMTPHAALRVFCQTIRNAYTCLGLR